MMVETAEKKDNIFGAINYFGLALDNYQDVFSDFDESPYNKRTISDDFTRELEKRYYENNKGEFEVVFSLPEKVRDKKLEDMIKRRIKDHYKLRIVSVDERVNNYKRHGLFRVGLGIGLLLLGAVLGYSHLESTLIGKILGALIIPAALFTVWTGYDFIFDRPLDFSEKKEFYTKFYNAKYSFVSEEQIISENVGTSDRDKALQKTFELSNLKSDK